MGVGQLSESDAVDALRLPFYSSSHPTGSHGWRNQFDLGNPDVIQNTVLGGPADRAGIVPGDIVLSADGQKVATVPDLTRLLKQEFTAGQEIDIELYREGGKETIKLVLGERPPQ